MKRKRIFIAINLPQNIKEELFNISHELKEIPAKWVKKENLHITLEFLGYLTDEEIAKTIHVTEKVAHTHSPFKVSLKKISYVPENKIPPRMIWVIGESKELSLLQKNLHDALKENNLIFSPEERFIPHITLARIRKWEWKKIEPEERPEVERELNLSFKVNSFEIMESHLKREGPEYFVLKSWNLKN